MKNRFVIALAALALLPDAAVNAELLFVRDGAIVISDDQRVPLDSLDGIATVEVLNRVAAGEKAEDVVAEIQADIEKMIDTNGSTERGHTIGLLHEHQWSGRDKFLVISSADVKADKVNYGIIPDFTYVTWFYPVRIWFITIYIPFMRILPYGVHTGPTMDFQSVMLYPGFEIKPPYNNGDYGTEVGHTGIFVTFDNASISELDAATVIGMYR
ncbi:MAG: hypothetical protein LBR16_07360 [Treponema sp.]|jgi:hypothetical protein|nr:hypothetical protein [Treponema sp.]